MSSTRYAGQILMKLARTDFRKMLRYKISWKSVHWEPSFSMRTDGRMDTDGQTEQKQESLLQFYERA